VNVDSLLSSLLLWFQSGKSTVFDHGKLKRSLPKQMWLCDSYYVTLTYNQKSRLLKTATKTGNTYLWNW